MISIPGDELELGWAGDGPGWAGDWSPSENLGFFHFYWEGWQVYHVLLCESIRASAALTPCPCVAGSQLLTLEHTGFCLWLLPMNSGLEVSKHDSMQSTACAAVLSSTALHGNAGAACL